MISRDSVSEIGKLAIPVKYEVNRQEGGLSLTRVLSSAHVENVEAEPYRSRGPNCRRILVKTESSKRLVVEFRSFPYDYKEDVDGVIRVTGPVIEGDLLSFEAASFIGSKRKPTDKERLSVVESWNQGIRYPKEVRDKNGNTLSEGLRKAQRGALHAIAAHWN